MDMTSVQAVIRAQIASERKAYEAGTLTAEMYVAKLDVLEYLLQRLKEANIE
jgi:hypothetical protein